VREAEHGGVERLAAEGGDVRRQVGVRREGSASAWKLSSFPARIIPTWEFAA